MEEEPQGDAAVNPAGLKPDYDFKRIFKRLPLLAEDIVMVKRLLLCLHERLWHASLRDVSNVLQRCGMPHEVWRRAADAVASCVVCRIRSRAGRRQRSSFGHIIPRCGALGKAGTSWSSVRSLATRWPQSAMDKNYHKFWEPSCDLGSDTLVL